MADKDHPAPAPTFAADAEAGAVDPQGPPDLVKKVTHEIDADDMFVQGGE